jgi:XRE family transcriptional regulator, regulator of sulfur utilization
MITHRDIAIAAVAILLTASAIGRAEQKQPVQGSAVFNWNSTPAKPTEIGSVRLLFKGPTATLDSLDIHVTTIDSGKAPHAPHKHLNEELVIIKEGTLEVLGRSAIMSLKGIDELRKCDHRAENQNKSPGPR